MQSSEETFVGSYSGGLPRRGPFLLGEPVKQGQAWQDHSRAEPAPSPWKFSLARCRGRTGSSGSWEISNTHPADPPEYNGLTMELLFPELSHSHAASIFVDPRGMFLQPFLAN